MDGTDATRDEMIESARSTVGDARFRYLLLELQLCAELYPDELRKVLATAFNIDAVTGRLDQIIVLANRAANDADEARALATEVTRDIDAKLSKVSDWAEWLDKRYRAGYAQMKTYIEKFNVWARNRQPPITNGQPVNGTTNPGVRR